jgi:hypothetical protein
MVIDVHRIPSEASGYCYGDLISAAEVRARISQIEKYNAAVHTFQTKYNNDLPGDMVAQDAVQFGLFRIGRSAHEWGSHLRQRRWHNTRL